MAMTVLRRSLMTTQISSSKTAPSFSSQRDITKMETKLDLSKVGNKNVNVHRYCIVINSYISLALYTIPFQVVNLILNGRPNEKFPDKFNVDIDTWAQGALEALSVVTRQLKVLQL